jgi:hypothetical protein
VADESKRFFLKKEAKTSIRFGFAVAMARAQPNG